MNDNNINQINAKAEVNYTREGPGIGAGASAFDVFLKHSGRIIEKDSVCLDVGFGDGNLLAELSNKIGCKLYGVDIADASIKQAMTRNDINNKHIYRIDVSHQELAFDSNLFDVIFCTEAIEHFSNPFFALAEIKRVLKHDGFLLLAFPRPEDNIGYGGGQHAHVYPGLFEKHWFEIFIRQLYFKIHFHFDNGSTAWYGLRNYKGPGVTDVFAMTSGNYDEQQLFACLEGF